MITSGHIAFGSLASAVAGLVVMNIASRRFDRRHVRHQAPADQTSQKG